MSLPIQNLFNFVIALLDMAVFCRLEEISCKIKMNPSYFNFQLHIVLFTETHNFNYQSVVIP